MSIPVNNMVGKRSDLSYGEYAIEPVDATIKNHPSWKTAIIIISLAILITGVVCLVLAATIIAPSTAIQALIIIGSQCVEIGGMALLINGILKISNMLNKPKKKEKDTSESLKTRKVQTKKRLLQEAAQCSRLEHKTPEGNIY